MIQESFNREDMEPVLAKFADYLKYEKSGGLKQGSIDRYLLNLRHFQQESGKHLFELRSYKDVADAIRGLRTRHNWSGSTTKNAADTASVFYNWAARFQFIKESPMQMGHEFKNKDRRQMDFFDWESADFKKLIYNPNNSVRDNAIFHTLRSSGLRAGELCDLKFRNPNDVFLKERVLRVREAKCNGWREANFDEETQTWLAIYIPQLERHSRLDHLFQNENFREQLSTSTLYKMVSRKADRIGIRAYPHKFRRSLGGEMISNGADLTMVKEQLGHKRISTTADHYVGFSTKRKKENYDRYLPKMEQSAVHTWFQ